MAPNTVDIVREHIEKIPPTADPEKSSEVEEPSNNVYGFRRNPNLDKPQNKTVEAWLASKREHDGAEEFWRVHDKLYDLTEFISRHPGGPNWLTITKGTDITEAFESSHTNPNIYKILKKYYVRDSVSKRNSPYTFEENGFYRTLKRKVAPILEKHGRGPSREMKVIQDGLLVSFVILAGYAAISHSFIAAAFSGIILAMAATCAHNFFHQKDNWRMYIFDLSLHSSAEWRISHALSHHIYPNTIHDLELTSFQPFYAFYPLKSKNVIQQYGAIVYFHFINIFVSHLAHFRQWLLGLTGLGSRLTWQTYIPLFELFVIILLSRSLIIGGFIMVTIQFVASYWFLLVGFTAAHHHPKIFHDGDAPRENRDWGYLQIDAVRERLEIRNNLFLVAIMFGDHCLHHLFPTVDHSKLPLLVPVLEETCREFKIEFGTMTQWELFLGLFKQFMKNKPS